MVQDVKQILINSIQDDNVEPQISKDSIKKELINNNQDQVQQLQSQSDIFDIQLIQQSNETEQQEIYAMTFNRNGSLLLSGGDNLINFNLFLEGKIEKIRSMFCLRSVSSLLFSQQSNDFISGHIDGNLQKWNNLNEIKYKNKTYENIKMETVRCLILNKTENQLMSCFDDSTINLYSLQFQKSNLLFKYSLKSMNKKLLQLV